MIWLYAKGVPPLTRLSPSLGVCHLALDQASLTAFGLCCLESKFLVTENVAQLVLHLVGEGEGKWPELWTFGLEAWIPWLTPWADLLD